MKKVLLMMILAITAITSIGCMADDEETNKKDPNMQSVVYAGDEKPINVDSGVAKAEEKPAEGN